MPPLFKAVQTGANPVAGPAKQRIADQHLGALLKAVQVALCLSRTPGFDRVDANAQQVRPGPFGKTERRPWLAWIRCQIERLANLREDIALGYAACVSLVDSRAQGFKLRFVEPLIPFQNPQRSAHHFAGVFKTPAPQLGPKRSCRDSWVRFTLRVA